MTSITANHSYRWGCSDIYLPVAQDGTQVCARTMDFPIPMNSQLVLFNKGQTNTSTAPDGSPGLQWTSKHGFVGVNAFGLSDVDEGMNHWLSFGVLTLQDTQYQTIEAGQSNIALNIMDVGKWILGNFASIKEVKEALSSVKIWGGIVPQIQSIPTLHIALHDKEGSAVIEFRKGKVKFYENPLGILTNDPPFKWHRQNLAIHTNVSSATPPNVTIGKETITTVPESGLNAQPGGLDSTSRFVRLFNLKRFMPQPSDKIAAVLAASHIMNIVDVLPGMAAMSMDGNTAYITTQWGTVKDLTNHVFYFRGIDLVLNSVDLKGISFEPGTQHTSIPIQSAQPFINNVTSKVAGTG